MNKIFAVSAFALAIGGAPCVFSQTDAPTTGDTDPVTVEGDLTNKIAEYREAHKDILDESKKECKVFTGVADISVKAGQKGHALARVTAYHKAFLSARQEFASFLEKQVTSSMENIAKEGGGLAEGDNEVLNTINASIIESLKKQAQAKGIDVNDKAAFGKFVKENVVGSNNFKQQVSAAGNSFQQGLIAYKTFANAEQVGVIAVFNQRFLSAAKALRSGVDNGIRGKAKTRLLDQIPKDAKTLANTFGCRILRNENGEYCIVGYGHGVAASKSSMSKTNAKKKAALQAINEIKQFAGEQIVFSGAQEQAEAKGELSDNTVVAEISDKLADAAKQEASSLIINGAKPITSHTIQLPSGEIIVVTATAWVPGNAMKAKKTAGEMLVGKDQKNQGIAAEQANGSSNKSAAPAAAPKVQKTELKAIATEGESDVSDLD